jgi:hypothetical protein
MQQTTLASREARFTVLHIFMEADRHGGLPVVDIHLRVGTITAIHAECQGSLAGYVDTTDGDCVMPMSAPILSCAR